MNTSAKRQGSRASAATRLHSKRSIDPSAAQDLVYGNRIYRSLVNGKDLVFFRVSYRATDALIGAERPLEEEAFRALVGCHRQLEGYIQRDPGFLKALRPRPILPGAPRIVRQMAQAAGRWGVGPMAAVAGAVAEAVGRALLGFSKQVIVENGGDIFLCSVAARTVALSAEGSPWQGRIGMQIPAGKSPLGICTSSGKIGRSLSFGRADAVTIVAESAALADAAATAVGNMIQGPEDIARGIGFCRRRRGLIAAVICMGERIGAWGDISLVDL